MDAKTSNRPQELTPGSDMSTPILTESATAIKESSHANAAQRGLNTLAFRQLDSLLHQACCTVTLRLWNGQRLQLGSGHPVCELHIHDPELPRRLLAGRRSLVLAEAYVDGDFDLDGDLYEALRLRRILDGQSRQRLAQDSWESSPTLPWPRRAQDGLMRLWQPLQRALDWHGRQRGAHDRRAVAAHYDVSNEFFALWLDPERVYSCAYFEQAQDTLEQAQCNKLDLVCRKLRLRAGERLLDVGCGWGGLLFWAARRYGVRAHGITLSQAQYAHVKAMIAARGMGDTVSVELRHYQDLPDVISFDKVASIGMAEHVGIAAQGRYLAAIRRVLKPGGLFLNHSITHDEDGWNSTTERAFINRFVFPNGELDRVSHLQLAMERAGFEIQDLEALRRHYALTLRHWVRRLEAQEVAAQALVNTQAYRTWRLYMAACALDFEEGGTGVYQILASGRGAEPALPLTRYDLLDRQQHEVRGLATKTEHQL